MTVAGLGTRVFCYLAEFKSHGLHSDDKKNYGFLGAVRLTSECDPFFTLGSGFEL